MAKDAAKGPEQGNGLWDALFGEIGRAVTEFRDQVVLEPWFGRAASHSPSTSTESVAEELGWVKNGVEAEQPAGPDHGRDFDR